VKWKRKTEFACLTVLLALAFILPVTASVTVPDSTYFGYCNGTYFTNPGTYDTVYRLNNVWYFDDVAYSGPVKLTGAAALLVGLVPLIWVLIVLASGATAIRFYLKIETEFKEKKKKLLTVFIIIVVGLALTPAIQALVTAMV
jgi:hypothetical protein